MMTVNRIVHLSKMTGTAGSEGHLLVLLHGLREHGLDVHLWILVAPHNPVQDFVDRADALGIPVERIVIHRHFDVSLWPRLVRRLRAVKPDVVHTHLLHADLYGIPAARLAHVPYVVSSRHNDDRFRRTIPMRYFHRWLWRRTDVGIAISEAIRQFCIEIEGAPLDRLHTIHYGLDPTVIQVSSSARADLRTSLNLPADSLLVGSVCRLIEQKGILYGLRGFAQVATHVPDAHYVIVGEGNQREELETEAHTLGLDGRVHFIGWRNDAHTIFAGLDVLLAPSLWEGFGLVFLEAMAASIPIISTCVSAIPEVVIDGETGWLVPPRDSEAVASALRDALINTDERRARGAAGHRRLMERFTVEMMVKCTHALYSGLEGD